jgi:hypothetical protein
MINVEQSEKCLAGETEVLGENLPQCRSTTNTILPDPASNPGHQLTSYLFSSNFLLEKSFIYVVQS